MTRCRALEYVECNANENYTHYLCIGKRNRVHEENCRDKSGNGNPASGVAAMTLFFLVDIGRTVNFIVGVP